MSQYLQRQEGPTTHHNVIRFGYSKKGWTNCELAVLWLKHFDEYTKGKANQHAHLLIVNGHNLHYSFEFLNYARANQIHVLCYPAHTTHIYQGLDVVIFSVLKWHWVEEKTKWEENGGEVTKETFLKIYGEAHIRTLTPELVWKAFEKTGVYLFNPDIISPKMMTLSKETSLKGALPLLPPTPVCITATSLHNILHPPSKPDCHPGSLGQQAHTDVTDLVNCTIHQLEDPELRYLTHTSPIKASAQWLPVTTTTILSSRWPLARLILNSFPSPTPSYPSPIPSYPSPIPSYPSPTHSDTSHTHFKASQINLPTFSAIVRPPPEISNSIGQTTRGLRSPH